MKHMQVFKMEQVANVAVLMPLPSQSGLSTAHLERILEISILGLGFCLSTPAVLRSLEVSAEPQVSGKG